MDIIYIHYKGKTNRMAQFVIEFDWVRDPKGYRFVETARPTRLRVVRNGKGTVRRILSQIGHSRQMCCSRYSQGPRHAGWRVGIRGAVRPAYLGCWDPKAGDPVDVVMFNADYMRQVHRYGWRSAPPNLLPVRSIGPKAFR